MYIYINMVGKSMKRRNTKRRNTKRRNTRQARQQGGARARHPRPSAFNWFDQVLPNYVGRPRDLPPHEPGSSFRPITLQKIGERLLELFGENSNVIELLYLDQKTLNSIIELVQHSGGRHQLRIALEDLRKQEDAAMASKRRRSETDLELEQEPEPKLMKGGWAELEPEPDLEPEPELDP